MYVLKVLLKNSQTIIPNRIVFCIGLKSRQDPDLRGLASHGSPEGSLWPHCANATADVSRLQM